MIYKDYTSPDIDVYDIDALNNSIKNILLTRKGTVPGKPTFGSNIHEVLFSHIDHITEGIIRKETKGALNQFEPRILVNEVTIKSIPEYNRIVITIVYEYRDKTLYNSASTNVTFNI